MKITSEKTGPSEVTLTIEVEEERVKDALRRTARQLSRRLKIPGFRPGKAPYPIIERYVGKDNLLDNALETLGPEVYGDAITEAKIAPYAEGNLDIQQREPLILKAVVPVQPVVTLGDYKAIRIPKKEVSVGEEDVERTLGELRTQYAESVPTERPVQEGDQVTIDLEGRAGDEVIFSQTSRRTLVRPGMFPDGLYERLIGATPGTVLDYEVSYPPDHPSEQFAGKTVSFHLEVLQVSERKLPELNDEFARTVGGFETLEELRAKLREQLITQRQANARQELEQEILDAILAISTLEYPNLAVEREMDRQLEEMKQQVANQGFVWESFLNITAKTEAETREELRPAAEKHVQRTLILSEVAKAEDITVSDEELAAEIERMSQSYGDQAAKAKDTFSNPAYQAVIMARMRLTKAMDRLVAIATGEATAEPAPVAESAQASEDSAASPSPEGDSATS